jgi:hypothetical protein
MQGTEWRQHNSVQFGVYKNRIMHTVLYEQHLTLWKYNIELYKCIEDDKLMNYMGG